MCLSALYTYLTSSSLCQSLLALLSHPLQARPSAPMPSRSHPSNLRLFLLSLLPPFLFPYIYLHTPRPPCFAATPRAKQASSAFCCRRLLPLPWACVRGERDEACMKYASPASRSVYPPYSAHPYIHTTRASTPIHAQSLTSVPHSSPNNHRQLLAGTSSPALFPPPQSQSKPSVNIAR